MRPPIAAADKFSMRRLRAAAALAFAVAIAPAAASAATSPVQARAQEVRRAIPVIEAYHQERGGTYVGLTVEKLRKWDPGLPKTIVIRRATKRSYCVETSAKPVVHYDGPRGPVRRGRCGVRGAVVPALPSAPPRPVSSGAAVTPLRAAVPAIEAFAADRGGYAGLTLTAIRRYDAGVRDVRVAWAARSRYCIETTSMTAKHHLLGPAQGPARGPCPPAGG